MPGSTPTAAVLVALASAASASAALRVTAFWEDRIDTPLLGFGNELVFQNLSDAGLNKLLSAAHGSVVRYPGGTPSDYWDWHTGCETPHPPDPACKYPAPPTAWASYVNQVGVPTTIYDVNQLHSDLGYQISGIRAMRSQGVAIRMLELGNEMYDSTRSDVMEAYPSPMDYALKMANWTAELKREFPDVRVAVIAARARKDLARLAEWNAGVFKVPGTWDAATIHVYAPLASVTSPEHFPALLAGAFDVAAEEVTNRQAEIPAALGIWVTELGTFGAPELDFTYLQALYKVLLAALMLTIPRVEAVLPYCLTCHDTTAPAFLPHAGTWNTTASGILHQMLFSAFDGSRSLVKLQLPVIGFEATIGWSAFRAQQDLAAVLLLNGSPQSASVDLSDVWAAAGVRAVTLHVAGPPRGGIADMTVPHALPEEVTKIVAAKDPVELPAYSVLVLRPIEQELLSI